MSTNNTVLTRPTLEGRIQNFLDLNYPCVCRFGDCDRNAEEAAEIARIAKNWFDA